MITVSRRSFVVLGLLAVGGALRWVPLPAGAVSWPWDRGTIVSTYLTDGSLTYPVARSVATEGALPQALGMLIEGPTRPGRLRSVVPVGVRLDGAQAQGDHVVVRLVSDTDVPLSPAAVAAVAATAIDASGATTASVTYNGRPVATRIPRPPMLYFASPGGLVVVRGDHRTVREALEAYRSSALPESARRLPGDVQVRGVSIDEDAGLVTLRFSFPESLHTLAVESPSLARTVLLGLIATVTDVPGIRAAQLDFDGRARLGLGQCSDLLRTPQARPRVLNDERVLD